MVDHTLIVGMSLADWLTRYNVVAQFHGNMALVPNDYIYNDNDKRWELFRLRDYVVTSSWAGSYWLRPRDTGANNNAS
jgi:hypothetical protein